MPRSFSWRMIFCTSATAIGSMPLNGSSISRNRGAVTNARAISSRRRSPADARRAVALRKPQRLDDGEDVLFDREFAEHRRLLRQVADAEPRPTVHAQAGGIGAVDEHPAARHRHEADNHVKRGG